MTTPADSAFDPDPVAGAQTARAMIRKATGVIEQQKRICQNVHADPQAKAEAPATAQAALDNAERWHAALCRHQQADTDDHALMDDLRVAAATVKPRPQARWCDVCSLHHDPPKCNRTDNGDNDLL